MICIYIYEIGADKLNSIKNMGEYRRALESVSTITGRLRKLIEDVILLSPKVAEMIVSMTPLASFSKVIGKSVEKIVDDIHKKQIDKMDNQVLLI